MACTRSKRKSEQHVPPELTEDILCLLPVKDLLRFRAVCRAWKTLIDSNPFKNKHFQAANNSLLICRRQRERDTKEPFIDYLLCMSPTKLSVSHSMLLHLCQFSESFRYNGNNTCPEFYAFNVVNGLVCLVYSTCVILWNPSTEQFRRIDSPPRNWVLRNLKELNVIGRSRRHVTKQFCAFWFDSKMEDYKIVIAQFTRQGKAIIQLYSSRKNTRKSFTQEFTYVVSVFRSNALLNGSFYWSAYLCAGHLSHFATIVRFDFRAEVFELIPWPEDCAAKGWSVVVTTGGCLELIIIDGVPKKQRCEVWAMGESGSWSKKLWFGLDSQVGVPRGITKDGQVIFKSRKLDKMLLIDPTSGSYKHLVHNAKDFWVYTYEESLFSIKH